MSNVDIDLDAPEPEEPEEPEPPLSDAEEQRMALVTGILGQQDPPPTRFVLVQTEQWTTWARSAALMLCRTPGVHPEGYEAATLPCELCTASVEAASDGYQGNPLTD